MADLFSPPVVELHASVDGKPPQIFTGRQAWALDALIRAGAIGCTPIATPGPRWSDYVFKLRRDGVAVETIDEGHGGAFRGTHARYVLRTSVLVLRTVREGETRHAA